MRTTHCTCGRRSRFSLGVLDARDAGQVGSQPGSGFTTVLSSAMRYTMNYEQRFALLAADEHYVQELQRPPNPGDEPVAHQPRRRHARRRRRSAMQTIKSDFLLVQLGGDGEGWMPFRDAYEVKGRKLRDRDDRLLKLFTTNDKERFEKAARVQRATAPSTISATSRARSTSRCWR